VIRWLSENKGKGFPELQFSHKHTPEFVEVCEEMRQRPGIYSFWNSQDQCLYVGRGVSGVGARIVQSFGERFRSYDRPVFLRYIVCSPSNAAVLEMYFITTLKPAMNRDGKFTDRLTVTLGDIPAWSEPVLCNQVER